MSSGNQNMPVSQLYGEQSVRSLTTGTLSGLGKHIYETLGGIGWTRQLPAENRKAIKNKGVDVIIHCAFNSRYSHTVNSDCLYAYLADNVLLTDELVSIPHQKFILLSTVAVYPRDPGPHLENEVINLDAVSGIYEITKLSSESIVRQHCSNYLILRCAGLLGKYARKNSLIRILDDESCTLTLSGDSRFYYVLHPDVSDFIQFAIKEDIRGIYNLSSTKDVSLAEIADLFGKKVNFGNFFYHLGTIDNSKITSIFPSFNKTSKEVIMQFVRERDLVGKSVCVSPARQVRCR
jgi:nucleoside-diphosphate-sugar epimerase